MTPVEASPRHVPNGAPRRRCAFVVATYGARYAPFVYAFLDSLAKSYPDPEVLLLYSSTPATDIVAFEGIVPRLSAKDISSAGTPYLAERHSTSEGLDQAISRKLRYWGQALNDLDAEVVAFCDSDLLIRRRFDHFLEDDDDLVITFLPKGNLLNSGVILCRNVPAVRRFFALWRDLTEQILASPERAREAMERNGGADQDALVSLLGYVRQAARFQVALPDGDVIRVRPVPCALLNEIRCLPVTEDQHIFHLKGRWHPIVLDGGSFGKSRPLESCRAIMQIWLDCFASGARLGMQGLLAKLGLLDPSATDGIQVVLRLAAQAGVRRIIMPVSLGLWPVAEGQPLAGLLARLKSSAIAMGIEVVAVPGRSGMRRSLAAWADEPYAIVLGDAAIGSPEDILTVAMSVRGRPPQFMSFPSSAGLPAACFRFLRLGGNHKNGPGLCADGEETIIWSPGALDLAYNARRPGWLLTDGVRPICGEGTPSAPTDDCGC